MIDTPQIQQTITRHTACIRLKINLEEMIQSFGPAVEELAAALIAHGMPPSGAAFAHHFSITCSEGVPTHFDFEVGFITEIPVTPAGRVYASEWPAQKVAHTTYQGPYEGLPGAWGDFSNWMENNSITEAADLWEHYIVGPHITPDSSQWRTELYRPIL